MDNEELVVDDEGLVVDDDELVVDDGELVDGTNALSMADSGES